MRRVIDCYNILVISPCMKIRNCLGGHSLFSLKTKGTPANTYQMALLIGSAIRRPKKIN